MSALRLAFADPTADDFRHWGDVVFQMHRACRPAEWQALPALDLAFQRHIPRQAGSPDLLAIWQTVVTRMRAHFWGGTVRAHHERNDLARLHRHHAELLEAFRAGPKSVAVAALERHIDAN